MARRRFLFLFALVLALPFLAPESAQAFPRDSLMTYYVGSCQNLTYNGFRFQECDNTVTQDGTLDGNWKCDDQYDCSEQTFRYLWYEKCNGTWYIRYVVYDVNSWPLENECHCT